MYLRQSSSCSSNFDISALICAIWLFSFLISCTFSAFAFVSLSAFFIACSAFCALSFRNSSKRISSSCSICSDLRSASSRCCARSSSLRISARFVSSDIWTRNISRFFAMKSAMFSFSFRRSRVAAATRLIFDCCAAAAADDSSFILRKSTASADDVLCPFSHTWSDLTRSRSASFRCCSSSRSVKTSSSVGIENGLGPSRPELEPAMVAVREAVHSFSRP